MREWVLTKKQFWYRCYRQNSWRHPMILSMSWCVEMVPMTAKLSKQQMQVSHSLNQKHQLLLPFLVKYKMYHVCLFFWGKDAPHCPLLFYLLSLWCCMESLNLSHQLFYTIYNQIYKTISSCTLILLYFSHWVYFNAGLIQVIHFQLKCHLNLFSKVLS